MDSITQGLLGGAIAECGFRGKLGRGATLMGAVGGVLPDLDIFVGWLNPWWTWQYHRHFTHSVLFAPIVAAPLAWIFWRRGDRRHFGLWVLCAYLAVATHPLLDLLTTYGTKLLVPLCDVRLGLDWIAIIDPVYTLILVGVLVACALMRRLDRGGKTWIVGVAGMALSLAYLGYGGLNHHGAMQRLLAHAEARGHNVQAARAIPNIGSVYVWRLIYRTPSGHYVGRTNTRFDEPPSFTHLPEQTGPLIAKANAHPHVRLFQHFTMGWARPFVVRDEAGPVAIYDDLRYAWPPDRPRSLWSVVVRFDRGGAIRSVDRAHQGSPERRSVGALWRMFWDELRTP